MKAIFVKLCLFFTTVIIPFVGQCEYSIVFIHIGPTIPSYLPTAISQAGLFNKNCNIILVANQSALKDFHPDFQDLTFVSIPCESLKQTKEHKVFLQSSVFENGFWKYASERFLYLYDLMVQLDLTNVFHLEYDNMLYVNLEELLPIFKMHYQGLGATFDNDKRCIPGFCYIKNKDALTGLARYFAKNASKGYNDMEILAIYREESSKDKINFLPIIMSEYAAKEQLVSPHGHTAANKNNYCNYFEKFNSIFDAAALGQYLGGIDPRNGPSVPGFINESCVFNPSLLQYDWIADNYGRFIPYASYNNTKCRINNLHIHSKKLSDFASK